MVKNPCLHSTIIVSELVTLCLELTHRIIHLLVGLYQLYTKVDRAVLEIQSSDILPIVENSGFIAITPAFIAITPHTNFHCDHSMNFIAITPPKMCWAWKRIIILIILYVVYDGSMGSYCIVWMSNHSLAL